jgi:F-type H+-transporting ATPase subunit b
MAPVPASVRALCAAVAAVATWLGLPVAAHAAGSGGAIDVDVDLTVFVQVGLFVVLLLVLKPLLFDPMLKLFEEREKRIEGARAEGRRMDNESAEAKTKYDAAMTEARAIANATRDKLRAEGAKSENEILAKVRDEVAKSLEEGRATLTAEVATAKTELGQSSQELGRTLAARLLGREVA